MHPGPQSQARCPKCQAPLGQAGGRCPFCGADVAASPHGAPLVAPLPGAQLHAAPSPGMRPLRPRPAPQKPKSFVARVGVGPFAGAAVLLFALLAAGAFFLLRARPQPVAVEPPPPVSTTPAPPPLNIHGIVLPDGPHLDPTDVLHMTRALAAERDARTDVRLLGIVIRGASMGKVNLDEKEASVTYQYLVVRRDLRAEKADERKGERVELTLRREAPPVTRTEQDPATKTVPEPLCVWDAAWQAAVASGLPPNEIIDVIYALEPQGKHGVWSFTLRRQPETGRVIDGRTCAIKASRQQDETEPAAE